MSAQLVCAAGCPSGEKEIKIRVKADVAPWATTVEVREKGSSNRLFYQGYYTQFWTYEDAEVCLWRIFSSLGEPERAVEWLVFHGMRTKGVQIGDTFVFPDKYKSYPDNIKELMDGKNIIKTRNINSSKNLKIKKPFFPNRGYLKIIQFAAYGESISVIYTIDNQIIRVNYGFTFL